MVAVGTAAWLSVITGALFTSLELWLSGTVRLEIVLPAMLGVHALIGLGEAVITAAAVEFILRTRPDLLGQGSASAQASRGWAVAGLLVVLAVILLAPLASANPDGLNRVAMELGFIHAARAASGPFAGYTIPLLGSLPVSRILAGLLGALAVLGLVFLIGRSARERAAR
jgi:cobalt/nickel transport system permease protein